MAQVPYDGGVASVSPDVRTPDNYQSVNPSAGSFGAHTAQALGNAGAAVSKIGEFWGDVQVDGALNNAMSSLNDTWEVFKTNNRGADALKNRQELERQLDGITTKSREGLNPSQIHRFDNAVRPFRERTIGGQVVSYMTSQAQTYARGVNDAAGSIALSTIPNVAGTSGDAPPDDVRHLIGDAKRAAFLNAQQQFGESADPKIVNEAVSKAEGAGYKVWIDTLAKTGNLDAALTASEKYKKELGLYYPQIAQELKAQREARTGGDAATRAIDAYDQRTPTDASGRPAPGARAMEMRGSTLERGQQVYQGFVRRGFNPAQAQALTGNLQQESSFRTDANNREEGAFGMMQWRLDRRDALNKFAADKGSTPTDPNVQMDFIVHEMQGSESRNAQAFLNAKTVEEANAALKRYIRYGDNSEAARLSHARQFGDGTSVQMPGGPVRPLGQYAMMNANQAWNGGNRVMTMPDLTQPPGPASLFEPPLQSMFDAQAIPPAPLTPQEKTAHLLEKQADLYDAMPAGMSLTEQRAYRQTIDTKVATEKLRIEAQEQAMAAAQTIASEEYKKRMLKYENSQSLYDDIQNDDRLKPEMKNALKTLILQGTGNRDTNDYGPSFWDASKAITAPYGTPGKIVDQTQLYEMWADRKITQHGFDVLQKELQAYKKPDAAGIASTKTAMMKFAESLITITNPNAEMFASVGMPVRKDFVGERIFNSEFVPRFHSAYDKWVADGNDPYKFLNEKNMRELVSGMRSRESLDAARLQMGEVPANAAVPAAPGSVDPDAWRTMMSSNPRTKQGATIPLAQFAGRIMPLVSTPTESMVKTFNESSFARAFGLEGRKLLETLKVPIQSEGGAPAPAPAAAPRPAAPAMPAAPGPPAAVAPAAPAAAPASQQRFLGPGAEEPTEADAKIYQQERTARIKQNAGDLSASLEQLRKTGRTDTDEYKSVKKRHDEKVLAALDEQEASIRDRLEGLRRVPGPRSSGYEKRYETELRELAERRKKLKAD